VKNNLTPKGSVHTIDDAVLLAEGISSAARACFQVGGGTRSVTSRHKELFEVYE